MAKPGAAAKDGGIGGESKIPEKLFEINNWRNFEAKYQYQRSIGFSESGISGEKYMARMEEGHRERMAAFSKKCRRKLSAKMSAKRRTSIIENERQSSG